jgi:hypothetical protein
MRLVMIFMSASAFADNANHDAENTEKNALNDVLSANLDGIFATYSSIKMLEMVKLAEVVGNKATTETDKSLTENQAQLKLLQAQVAEVKGLNPNEMAETFRQSLTKMYGDKKTPIAMQYDLMPIEFMKQKIGFDEFLNQANKIFAACPDFSSDKPECRAGIHFLKFGVLTFAEEIAAKHNKAEVNEFRERIAMLATIVPDPFAILQAKYGDSRAFDTARIHFGMKVGEVAKNLKNGSFDSKYPHYGLRIIRNFEHGSPENMEIKKKILDSNAEKHPEFGAALKDFDNSY